MCSNQPLIIYYRLDEAFLLKVTDVIKQPLQSGVLKLKFSRPDSLFLSSLTPRARCTLTTNLGNPCLSLP